jgi:2'-5' RNA ligase
MQSESLNIVIYPPKEINQKAIAISKQLKKNGNLFILDDLNYFPHVSIYSSDFPLRNIPKIRKALRDFAAETKPFRLTSIKNRQNKKGFVDVVYRRSRGVRELQKNIIALLNPLREGLLRPRDEARMSQLREVERRNVRRYGYRSVGSEFFPHVTFTRLEKYDKSAFSKIEKSNFSFNVEEMGLFYLGQHGTCRKLIEIFKLKN